MRGSKLSHKESRYSGSTKEEEVVEEVVDIQEEEGGSWEEVVDPQEEEEGSC